MSISKCAKRWDERRKVAVENLKRQIEKYQKSGDAEKLKKASAVLAGTLANMGKGLSALKTKAPTDTKSILS